MGCECSGNFQGSCFLLAGSALQKSGYLFVIQHGDMTRYQRRNITKAAIDEIRLGTFKL